MAWPSRGGQRRFQGKAASGKGGPKGGPKGGLKGGREEAEQEHKRVNKQIIWAANGGDLEGLLAAIEEAVERMNLINLSTSFHRVAKLALTCNSRVREQVPTHPALAKLRVAVSDQVLSESHQPQDRASEMRCMSIICWSCATLRIHEEALFHRVASVVPTSLHEMKPFEISNLLWAFAKLTLGSSRFYDDISPFLIQRQPGQFTPQCLSTIIWAFGTAKAYQVGVFASISREMVSTLPKQPDLAPQGLANTAWAFARVRRQDTALFKVLADLAVKGDTIWAFKPQEVSNLAWAFATVGVQHGHLFELITDFVLYRPWELPTQNVANLLWAYSKLAAPSRLRLFPTILEVANARLETHKPQEISAILWGLARQTSPALLPICRDFFVKVPNHFGHRLNEFTTQALACLVEAYVIAEFDRSPFLEWLVLESLQRLPDFHPPSICTLLRGLIWSLARGPTRWSYRALEAVAEHIGPRLDTMQPHNIAHLKESVQILTETQLEANPCMIGLRRALSASEVEQSPPLDCPHLEDLDDIVEVADFDESSAVQGPQGPAKSSTGNNAGNRLPQGPSSSSSGPAPALGGQGCKPPHPEEVPASTFRRPLAALMAAPLAEDLFEAPERPEQRLPLPQQPQQRQPSWWHGSEQLLGPHFGQCQHQVQHVWQQQWQPQPHWQQQWQRQQQQQQQQQQQPPLEQLQQWAERQAQHPPSHLVPGQCSQWSWPEQDPHQQQGRHPHEHHPDQWNQQYPHYPRFQQQHHHQHDEPNHHDHSQHYQHILQIQQRRQWAQQQQQNQLACPCESSSALAPTLQDQTDAGPTFEEPAGAGPLSGSSSNSTAQLPLPTFFRPPHA